MNLKTKKINRQRKGISVKMQQNTKNYYFKIYWL